MDPSGLRARTQVPCKPYLFPTSIFFDKTKAHLWKCSKIDLNGSHSAVEDRASVLSQVQQQSAKMQIKGLLGLSVFERIKELFIRLIVGIHIAFIILENPTFRALLDTFSSTLAGWTPNDGDVLRSWIMKAYHNRKVLLAKEMRQARSNIHLSFDLWTSDNSIAFVAVVAHYIDDDAHPPTTLIGLRRVIDSHVREVIAEQVVQIFQEYGIEKRLGYFALDNRTGNDTCVEAVLSEIRSDHLEKERRLQCMGHIIFYIAKMRRHSLQKCTALAR